MNNIISKVAASALVMGMVVSSINAKSTLAFNGTNTTNPNKSFSVDIKGESQEANLTFIPRVNGTQGSGFTLKFTNGGYPDSYSQLFLCANNEGNASLEDTNLTVVGNLFSQGQRGTIINHIMTAPQFQFKNDANESLIKAKTHIFFRVKNDCSGIPQMSGVGSSCQTVTAQIVDGKTTQGTSYPDYDTNVLSLGKTIKSIKIGCLVPVCKVDARADMKKFTQDRVISGINGHIRPVTNIASGWTDRPNDTAQVSDCPNCDEIVNCITYVELNNSSADRQIDALKLALDFYNEKGEKANDTLKIKTVEVTIIDTNDNEQNKTLSTKIDGSVVRLADLNLGTGANKIKLTIVPTEKDVIPTGEVKARIYDLETNVTRANKSDVKLDEVKELVTFQVEGLTKFTVPYMNTNYKTFVKITTKSEDAPAQLSAVITDQNGKQVEVELDPIKPKGTVYLFSTFGPLYEAAKSAGLANAWTVDFTTSAAAVVDSYMSVPNGERRVEAFD